MDGSYAARNAAGELREAERAVEALERVLGPIDRQHGDLGRLNIYLSDPLGEPAGIATAGGRLIGPAGEISSTRRVPEAIVRIVQPEAPGQPIALAITPLLITDWFGAGADMAAGVEVSIFIRGLAGIVTARLAGTKIEKAHDGVKAEMAAGRPVSIFSPTAGISHSTDMACTSFVAYMLDAYGAGAVRTFFLKYDPQRSDQASVEAFQRPLGTLEEQWLTHLRRADTGPGNFRVLLSAVLPLFKPYWRQQIELFAYMLLALAYSLAIPLASKYLVDTVIPSGSLNLLLVFVVALFSIYFLNLLVGMRRTWLGTWVNSHILMSLQERMFAHLQSLPHSYYLRSRTGDIMTRLFGDLQVVQGAMVSVVNTGIYMTLSAIGASIALLILNPLLALLVFLVVPLFAAGYFALRSRLQKVSYERQRLSGELSSTLQENLTAHAVVKAFGLEQAWERIFHNRLMAFFKSTMRLVLLDSLFESSTDLAMTLGEVLVLGVGGYLAMQGSLTVGSLLAFFGFLPSIFMPVGALANLGQTVQTASGSLERVNELLDEPLTIAEKPGAVALPPLSQEIKLEHLNFGYTGDRLVLQDLSLTIPAGSHVAIVGPSGSGKSTVVNLLMRYWDPDEGRVLFDGRDLSEVTLASLRGQIGLVFQDTFIFDTTLRENIGLSKPGATDAEIAAAAKAARLESYIEGLPAGYDTVLGERGVRMSGGQRQRLAIARALVRDPRILILDEATSALDATTEREILDTLVEVARGRTTVSITHRIAFAAKAGLIFVLENGRLVEQGTHADLVQAGGLYASLYEEQMGAGGAGRASVSRTGLEAARLHAIPLFSNLGTDALRELGGEVMRERYAGGEDVVRQGEQGDKLYIIDKGQVEILLANAAGDERRVNVLNEGDYFGEMALLAGEPRNATVRTTMPSALYSLSQADFTHLLESAPDISRAVSETVEARRAALVSVHSG
jgi:ABC-type multidrug transport system fused ATPase/permease subunit